MRIDSVDFKDIVDQPADDVLGIFPFLDESWHTVGYWPP